MKTKLEEVTAWGSCYLPAALVATMYPCRREYIYQLVSEGKIEKRICEGWTLISVNSVLEHQKRVKQRSCGK